MLAWATISCVANAQSALAADNQVKSDSDKYRVIDGTTSPDGRYGIALGFGAKRINWDDLLDERFDWDNKSYFSTYALDAERREDPPNYVVDLSEQRILGETGCEHFTTRQSYSHQECGVVWSPDSKYFVQLTEAKWFYLACRAGRIAAGPKLVGVVDLGKYAEKAASRFLAAHKRKYEGSIALSLGGVTNDGVIDLEIVGQGSSVPNKGDVYFRVNEQIRVRQKAAGLRLETVSIHNAPEDRGN
jgi:hypothetical protein